MNRFNRVDKWLWVTALLLSLAVTWNLPLEQAGAESVEYLWFLFVLATLFLALLFYVVLWIVVWSVIPHIWHPRWYPRRQW